MTLTEAIKRNEQLQRRMDCLSAMSDHCRRATSLGANGFARIKRLRTILFQQMIENIKTATIE